MAIQATLAVAYFLAPWLIVFVLGKSFSPSISVFRALLLPTFLFIASIAPVSFLLYSLGKPQISTINSFISFIIVVLGNFVFIPRFGRFGPIFSLTFAYGFSLISVIFFSIYYYRRLT